MSLQLFNKKYTDLNWKSSNSMGRESCSLLVTMICPCIQSARRDGRIYTHIIQYPSILCSYNWLTTVRIKKTRQKKSTKKVSWIPKSDEEKTWWGRGAKKREKIRILHDSGCYFAHRNERSAQMALSSLLVEQCEIHAFLHVLTPSCLFHRISATSILLSRVQYTYVLT